MTEDEVRAIVRQEIASLAGKALRRTQDESFTRSPIHNEAQAAANQVMAHFWGEVLSEYGDAEIRDGDKVVGWPVPAEAVEQIAPDYADSAE
jgi:hypothetical protein